MTRIASALAWPLLVLASLVAAIGALTSGYPFGLICLAVIVIGATVMVENLLPADATANLSADPQRWNDLGHYVVGGFGAETIGHAIVALVAVEFAERVTPLAGSWTEPWPITARIVLFVVAADLVEYGRHRLLHRIPRLWRIHALHHSADRLHVLKSGRVHALDVLSRAFFVFAPLMLIGAPPIAIPIYSAALLVLGPISHANLDLRIPRWLHSLVVTPPFHALHHARSADLSNANFSAVFPVWDLVFGTFVRPDDFPRPDFGIDGELPCGFLAQLTWPFRSLRLPR